jgi:ABC-type multidrug transport system fused ATPase/permease subunit
MCGDFLAADVGRIRLQKLMMINNMKKFIFALLGILVLLCIVCIAILAFAAIGSAVLLIRGQEIAFQHAVKVGVFSILLGYFAYGAWEICGIKRLLSEWFDAFSQLGECSLSRICGIMKSKDKTNNIPKRRVNKFTAEWPDPPDNRTPERKMIDSDVKSFDGSPN